MLETRKGSCMAVPLFVSICGTHLQAGRAIRGIFTAKIHFFHRKMQINDFFFEVARLLGHLTPIFAPDF